MGKKRGRKWHPFGQRKRLRKKKENKNLNLNKSCYIMYDPAPSIW
jgi:hypothetical protein